MRPPSISNAIVGHFEDAGVPFVVMTPPPIEPAKRLYELLLGRCHGLREPPHRADRRRPGGGILDLQKAFRGFETARRRTGITTDGIHLSAEAYRLLHDMLETTIAAVTARRGDERGQSARR